VTRAAALAALAAAVVAACRSAPQRASCAEPLGGLWRGPDGREWVVLDRGARLEVYPAFADAALPPGADRSPRRAVMGTDAPATPSQVGADPALELEAAPRVLDLTRAGAVVTGTVHRRFQHRGAACDQGLPVRVSACAGATLTIELPEPPAPTAVEPCTFPPTTAPAAQQWTWVARAD
jgi:hypothetical protein